MSVDPNNMVTIIPIGAVYVAVDPVSTYSFVDIAALGRALWKELHTCHNPSAEWLAEWESRIPQYGCQCQAKYLEIKANNPPRFIDWFPWTVETHNAVNQSLTDKPTMSIADAHEIWNIPIPLPERAELRRFAKLGRTRE